MTSTTVSWNCDKQFQILLKRCAQKERKKYMESMTLTEFERKLYRYKASKHNVSDDDRL